MKLVNILQKYYTETNAALVMAQNNLTQLGVDTLRDGYSPLACEVCGTALEYIEALVQPPTAAFSVELGGGERLWAEVRGEKGNPQSVLLWVDNPLCGGEKVLWTYDPDKQDTGCTCDW